VSDSSWVARVVLDSRLPQLSRLFDYLIPAGVEVAQGVRVRVPLRSAKRLAEGYVVEIATTSDHAGTLAEVAEVVSPVPVLPRSLWELASTVAGRSSGNPSDVLRLAIPKRYVKAEKSWWDGGEALERVRPTPPALGATGPSELLALTEPGVRTSLTLPYGVVSLDTERVIPRSAHQLARIAHAAWRAGQSVILVCPDWRDIEHYSVALGELIPEESLVLLSGDQPPARRYAQYLRTLEPSAAVVLGNRHAVYSPAHNLGLIVVVDDADSAHREPLSPYPHTRDVALVRNSLEGVAVCFAGVQASLSVRRWVDMGYIHEVSSATSSRPRVIATSLSLGHDATSSPARLPSAVYQAAKEALATGPVLVQVFRAGFSPGLSCSRCKDRATCHQCGGPLRKGSASAQPTCAWCGVVARAWACTECEGRDLVPRGQAIGRTMSDLGKSFPSVPVIRSDGEHVVTQVGTAPALVVATRGAEPVTPGGYQVVLLLDGAAMLQRDSLGALEESIQAWEHAISLVSDDGVCYVTDLEGPPAMALAAGNWTSLLRHELTQRGALKLPPTARIASLSGPSGDVDTIRKALTELSPQIDALGPVPLSDGGVLAVVRFPYSLGETVTRELVAWRQRLASGPRRQTTERVKIVVDDSLALDALSGE
jgi:primosomal protein N' (replication factor Y) (superfamily II helicase)